MFNWIKNLFKKKEVAKKLPVGAMCYDCIHWGGHKQSSAGFCRKKKLIAHWDYVCPSYIDSRKVLQ